MPSNAFSPGRVLAGAAPSPNVEPGQHAIEGFMQSMGQNEETMSSFFTSMRLAFCLFLVLCVAQRIYSQAPPHLLLGKADFVRLNALARQQPWAARQRQAILDEAKAFPVSYETRFGLQSFALPPEGGQWLHYYACPDTGSQLEFHPPDRNVCPDTGQVFKGYPYDQVVYMLRADALEKGTLAEALAFRLTNNRVFAERAATVLKAYADKYLSYPMHDNNGKESQFGARVYSQTLDESIWLIDMAWAYDLIRSSDVLTAADRTHIERDLLYASAMTVSRANMGPTPNIQNWILGAEMAVGYTLNDSTLVTKALDGNNGLRSQLKTFVKDGFWSEGAWGYQFYALRPILFMAQMSSRAGVNLWKQEPNITALLASPIGVMFPNGVLPAFNDSHEVALADEVPLYEVAYSATGNPLFAAIAAEGKRDSRFAYLFGATSLGNAHMPALRSAVFPDAGYATLRSPSGDITQIIKFGPHGGGHGHFDKLNELIYAEGGMMGVDTGTHYYGIPIHREWDKRTVAHNTVAVDEHDQQPATGSLLDWQSKPDFTAVSLDAGPVYAGVDLQRTEIVTNDYILEITRCRSTDGREHDFDWLYHNYGAQAAEGEFLPYSGFPQQDGYQMLTENQHASIAGDIHTTFTMDKGRTLRVWMLKDTNASQVFTGEGPGPDLRVKIPYIIVRRHGSDADFVTLFEPSENAAYKVQTISQQGNEISIRGVGFQDSVSIGGKIDYRHETLP